MDLFSQTDWPKALKPLIEHYRGKQHPLDYKNQYQLLVMVILSAQDSDAHINKIAPGFFKKYPDMKALSKANSEELTETLSEVRFHSNKIAWLQEIAETLQEDKNIPTTMKELTALKGVGRKSANVIMREAGVSAEGIMVDLHVVRVAPRLGIVTEKKDANKIEKQLMEALPKNMWSEIGMAISFLGREVCRPTNPKHNECILNEVCDYCNTNKN
ncbi:DNA lyase [Flavobacterium akiainvivens]|uniref:DNA lyase n=1 Tax=Flavobacterium akiainvivens TaxID=1202724 RepID=A0A0M8MDJ4_9FLAO|nr:endonuclease III [Flavobacterium akiainvivens]KOS07955.1 DNA lyase [Flavobacterium akiainvivens]SFQ61134.1 DNA-(apurinic or apyrimidinic site) lyase /endonuclease III [Flavobacterium akiainvivens]